MKRLLTLTFVAFLLTVSTPELHAQCSPLANAIVRDTLISSVGGTNNRSGMVYNPNFNLYYSVNAGAAGYPIDVYNSAGTLIDSVTAGFDYRGAWWNPTANQFEGNTFNDNGVVFQTLETGTGIPLGSGGVLFAANQPDPQSLGDLDYDANEIIYYFDGFIHRYSRIDNSFLGQYLITSLPVAKADINSNSVVYTGCETREIGIYDHVNQRLLFINKATGKYNGFCQLPPSAPQRSSFGMSYANGLLWLFESGTWNSYQVVSIWATDIEEELQVSVSLFPNPASNRLTVSLDSNQGAVKVSLFTIQGQLVVSESFASGEEPVLDISGLATGTYFAKIQLGDAAITKKFMKE